jgi:hypothetical protein
MPECRCLDCGNACSKMALATYRWECPVCASTNIALQKDHYLSMTGAKDDLEIVQERLLREFNVNNQKYVSRKVVKNE